MFSEIEQNILSQKRISEEQALFLYENAELDYLKKFASIINNRLHKNNIYYNKNIHFEPTNKCIYSCKFCSFYRKVNDTAEDGAWDYSKKDLLEKINSYPANSITEIHITGGIHPKRGIDWAEDLISFIKEKRPNIHIKAFTAIEIIWLCKISKISIEDGLKRLIKTGLSSLPGGGAEIFDNQIRKEIAGSKFSDDQWLKVHEIAHKLGLCSNASMLYGHIENYKHRINHMSLIRSLQDKTNGFLCFIPLKYRQENNQLPCQEVSLEEDFRCFSIARIFFDNIKHLKAYWVMLGIEEAFKTFDFGVNDIDGTIHNSTKIYSMAGSMKNPTMTEELLQQKIKNVNKIPIERDSLYNKIS